MPAQPTADSGGSRVRLDSFKPSQGLDRGRSKLVEAAWYLTKSAFFLSALPWPNGLKRALLRLFGARVGKGVVIKPRVSIHFPWKLAIGDHCWLGEECWILNFEPVELSDHVCLSQRAFLCCGNHDFRAPDFAYRNGPIRVGRGAWVGAQVFVAANVTVADYAVATAGSVVLQDLPAGQICSGHPCRPVRARFSD
jgi:putative colanic acid biosynthesis acetyltransferase WcaF